MQAPVHVLLILSILPMSCGLLQPSAQYTCPNGQIAGSSADCPALQHGCAYDNPSCHPDFDCVNSTCVMETTPYIQSQEVCDQATNECWHQGCSNAEGKSVCILKNVVVKGPSDKVDIIAERTQVLQKQYDFLETYLGFQPAGPIVGEYADNFSAYCPGTYGCTIEKNFYWRPKDLGIPASPGDHEMNHAFVSDIPMVWDFGEAQARYLSLKEEAYFYGYDKFLDYYQYGASGYFYTPDENNLNWTEIGSPDVACENATAESMYQCKYLFLLIQYDQKDMLPYLLKNAFEKNIDLSTPENLDTQINEFISG